MLVGSLGETRTEWSRKIDLGVSVETLHFAIAQAQRHGTPKNVILSQGDALEWLILAALNDAPDATGCDVSHSPHSWAFPSTRDWCINSPNCCALLVLVFMIAPRIEGSAEPRFFALPALTISSRTRFLCRLHPFPAVLTHLLPCASIDNMNKAYSLLLV
jgi:hypothetical protein